MIRLGFIGALIIGCFALSLTAEFQSGDIENERAAVVKLRIHRQDGTAETAAGIFMGKDQAQAYFVTVYHAVSPSQMHGPIDSIQLQFFTGPELFTASVLPNYDEDLDLAVVMIPTAQLAPGLSHIAPSSVSPGMAVRIIGHPASNNWSVWEGHVQNENASAGDISHFTTNSDLSLAGGYSGGPVFDSQGNVLGIHLSTDGGYGKALKMQIIAQLLSTWRVPTDNLATPSPVVEISISPANVTSLSYGQTQIFSARIRGMQDQRVTWSATGGNISQSGLFRAGSQHGSATLKATSDSDPSKTASLTFSIDPAIVQCVLEVDGLPGYKQDIDWTLDGQTQPKLKTDNASSVSTPFSCSQGSHSINVNLKATLKGTFGGYHPTQSCHIEFDVDRHAQTVSVSPHNGEADCDIDATPRP